VEGDDRLVERLDAWTRPGGRIAVRVNASALAAVGYVPEIAPAGIAGALLRVPGLVCRVDGLGRDELREFPSQWSKRLGYGRPTSAWIIAGTRRAATREDR
jgi:hypothetical protein